MFFTHFMFRIQTDGSAMNIPKCSVRDLVRPFQPGISIRPRSSRRVRSARTQIKSALNINAAPINRPIRSYAFAATGSRLSLSYMYKKQFGNIMFKRKRTNTTANENGLDSLGNSCFQISISSRPHFEFGPRLNGRTFACATRTPRW